MTQQIFPLPTNPAARPRSPLQPQNNNSGPFAAITLPASLLRLSVHEWTMSQLLISDAAGRERAWRTQPTAEKPCPSCAVGGAVEPASRWLTGARAQHFQLTEITMAAPAAQGHVLRKADDFFFPLTVSNLFLS